MTKIYKSRVDLFFYATALAIVLSLFIPIPFIYRDILPLTVLLSQVCSQSQYSPICTFTLTTAYPTTNYISEVVFSYR